jgi:replicative DNA helicase
MIENNEDACPEQMMAAFVLRIPDDTLNEAEGVIAPSMFENDLCRRVWEACSERYAENKPCTLQALRKDPRLKGCGEELRRLRGLLVSTAHLSFHISEFIDLVSRRRLMDVAKMIDEQITTLPAAQIIDSVMRSIGDIASDSGSAERRTSDAKQVMLETLQSIEESQKRGGKLIGYATGIGKLDRAISGLQGGRVYVIAGRPASGKSLMGVQIASYACRYHQVPTVMFSLEMSNTEIGQRMLASESGVEIGEIMEGVDDGSGNRAGSASASSYLKINQAAATLAQTKMLFRDYPIMTALSLRVEVRKHVQKYGVKIILIDYLQLFTMKGNAQDRRLAIGEVTKTCKQLAKQYDIAIILISQLNRDGDGKTNMSLNMLSDSDEIGRDADCVMCLNSERDLDVIKNRSGATGFIPLDFDGPHFRFTEGRYED